MIKLTERSISLNELDSEWYKFVITIDFVFYPLQFQIWFVVGKGGSFDYISVTPPYTEVDYGMLMGQISKSPLIGEDTFVVSLDLMFSALHALG